MENSQKMNSARLVWNEKANSHADIILRLLAQADQMDCMVAFAKTSSLETLMKALKKALARGMVARFAVGLSLYVTEPSALRDLLDLGRKHEKNFKLYLSNCRETFHPKIYAFRKGSHHSLVVGSANLTAGGFHANHEASILIEGSQQHDLTQSVSTQLDRLIEIGELVLATDEIINHYECGYRIKKSHDRLGLARLTNIKNETKTDSLSLIEILEIMRTDSNRNGLEYQTKQRKKMRNDASSVLKSIAKLGEKNLDNFLPLYDDLIKSFHSGGLVRAKGRISRHADEFVRAISQIKSGWKNLPAHEAFSLLHARFIKIKGAGINVLTEILHVQNNKKFAVMNQNSVAGLKKAAREGLLIPAHDYAQRPSKSNVSPSVYADYCKDLEKIRKFLGLRNFTELDALFNYVYWKNYQDDTPQL